MLPKEMVMRVNKMITKEKMLNEEHKTGHYPNIIPDQNLWDKSNQKEIFLNGGE